MTTDGAALVLHAGADHMFALEEVDEALAEALLAGVVSRPTTPVAARDTFDQLVTLGALRPQIVPHGSRTDTSIVWSGRPLAGLAADVEAQVTSARLMASGGSLVAYVRTTATLEETARLAAEGPTVPHLLVDAAYHHTISLGPLVVPGDTSCLTCLTLRVSGIWGDDAPPPEPGATARPTLLAAILAAELDKIVTGDTTLVNRTLAVNLATWQSTEATLLRSPWCPGCGTGSH